MSKICVKAIVCGKVQGVWFRQSTLEQAESHGVSGWAKNRADGSVEVLLCGEEQAVREVQQWLQEGPPLAVVEDVQSEEYPYQEIADFKTL